MRTIGSKLNLFAVESEDAAIQKVEQDMYDGGFDVIDGWCDDANTYIVE